MSISKKTKLDLSLLLVIRVMFAVFEKCIQCAK